MACVLGRNVVNKALQATCLFYSHLVLAKIGDGAKTEFREREAKTITKEEYIKLIKLFSIFTQHCPEIISLAMKINIISLLQLLLPTCFRVNKVILLALRNGLLQANQL